MLKSGTGFQSLKSLKAEVVVRSPGSRLRQKLRIRCVGVRGSAAKPHSYRCARAPPSLKKATATNAHDRFSHSAAPFRAPKKSTDILYAKPT